MELRTSCASKFHRRGLLLGAIAAGMSLPLAFKASNVEAAGEKLVVGFSIWGLSISFAVVLADALKKAAAENNIELRLVEAKFDASLQAENVSDFIVQKVDVICATPIDVRGILPAARAARKAGIPFIACLGVVEGFPYIGADDLDYGRKMGGLMIEALEKSGKQGPFKVALLRALPGGAPDRLRRQGIMEVFGKRTDVEVVAEIITEWSPDKALSGTQDLLQKFKPGELNLIHGFGAGVETAAAKYTHTVAKRTEIIFTGGELTIQTKEGIENGWEYGVIIQDPATAGHVVATALPKMRPDFSTVPADAIVPLPTCTKANLSSFAAF